MPDFFVPDFFVGARPPSGDEQQRAEHGHRRAHREDLIPTALVGYEQSDSVRASKLLESPTFAGLVLAQWECANPG